MKIQTLSSFCWASLNVPELLCFSKRQYRNGSSLQLPKINSDDKTKKVKVNIEKSIHETNTIYINNNFTIRNNMTFFTRVQFWFGLAGIKPVNYLLYNSYYSKHVFLYLCP